MQRVGTINGVRKRKGWMSAAESQRKRRRTIALSIHRFKQAVMYGALIGCAVLGLRCMSLEKTLTDYRMAFADMRAYQIANGITFESESENPQVMVSRYKAQIEKADKELAEAAQIKEDDQKLAEKLNTVVANMVDLDMQNASLIASNEEYYNQLQVFQNRQKLYDKYSWALYNKQGERNDITFDQLKTGEDILLKAGLDPDILWGFVITESGGDENAKNPNSTATGHGQVLASTGKSVYEKIMGNGPGSFNSSMLLDGDVNIRITSEYLAYLKENSSSIYEVVDKYAGEHNEAYYRKLDETLKKGGTSLADIDKNTYQSTESMEHTVDGPVGLTMTADVDH